MVVEVKVAGLALDEKSKAPIVVLKNDTGEKVLPIVIGVLEASAIAAALEKIDFPRPMTHDLAVNLIRELCGTLERIEVTDLINDTFYAVLVLSSPKGPLTVDARPSDSIALALRTGAPIFVSEKVFEKTAQRSPEEGGEGGGGTGGGDDPWRDMLENLDDEDFGKYKM
jgi:bifunctional DNase/RNase